MDKNSTLSLIFMDIAAKKIFSLMDLILRMEIKNFTKQDCFLKY